MAQRFQFAFALEVLNHLGRGLYRNFATVVAEVISNSWDAEATEVKITIDKHKKSMIVEDNGKGMNEDDFQNKFLKVGYSRRKDDKNTSKRKVLGRKGIGKLAMLSISAKVTVISKKEGEKSTGGIIDNSQLDERIGEDGKYSLGLLSTEDINYEHGTKIIFEEIKDRINNPEIIKKYLAMLFNFSFSSPNEKFKMFINTEEVSQKSLGDLHRNTQSLWLAGDNDAFNNKIKERYKENQLLSIKRIKNDDSKYKVSGYIASVTKPSQLNIHGTGLKAGLHLFANGRLRQENFYSGITPDKVAHGYLYGEIHVDAFDDSNEDIFTSNREGVIEDNDVYQEFLKRFGEIANQVNEGWRELRKKLNGEGMDKSLKGKGLKLDDFNIEKKKIIEGFLNEREGDGLKEKAIATILQLPPEKSAKKVLICHSSEDKDEADIIEKILHICGFSSKEILYTSSEKEESIFPLNTNIFEYIRKFFIQDWYKNPTVFFIVSKNWEKSWNCCLEAGATWVTGTSHHSAIKGTVPKRPLNDDNYIYLDFENISEIYWKECFKHIMEKHKKQFSNEIDNKIEKILNDFIARRIVAK